MELGSSLLDDKMKCPNCQHENLRNSNFLRDTKSLFSKKIKDLRKRGRM